MSLDEAVSAFEQRYRRYLIEMAEAKQRSSKVRRASTFLSQRRPFADDPIHAQAMTDLTELADDVTAALDDKTSGSAALVRVTRLVLAEKKANEAEYWPLVALEGLAKPWLDRLDMADLKDIR